MKIDLLIISNCRDLTNGYLVAEIFSWYYPQEVQMHMYNNGTSLDSKLRNWSLLKNVSISVHQSLKEFKSRMDFREESGPVEYYLYFLLLIPLVKHQRDSRN